MPSLEARLWALHPAHSSHLKQVVRARLGVDSLDLACSPKLVPGRDPRTGWAPWPSPVNLVPCPLPSSVSGSGETPLQVARGWRQGSSLLTRAEPQGGVPMLGWKPHAPDSWPCLQLSAGGGGPSGYPKGVLMKFLVRGAEGSKN